jgi:hypothetical protein
VRCAGGSAVVHCAAGQSRSSTVVMAYLLAYVKIKTESKALAYAQKRRPMVKPNDGFRKILQKFHKKGYFKELGKGVTIAKTTTTTTTKKKKKSVAKKGAASLAASRGLDLSKLGGLGKKLPVKKKKKTSTVETSNAEHVSSLDAIASRPAMASHSRRRPHRKRFNS